MDQLALLGMVARSGEQARCSLSITAQGFAGPAAEKEEVKQVQILCPAQLLP
jgi:hypothetical protein